MKRGIQAVLLCAAALVLNAPSLQAAGICTDWAGMWTFNYNWPSSEAVNITEVCYPGGPCTPANSIFNCQVKGRRLSDNMEILIGQVMFDTSLWGYYETYSPGASTPYDKIPSALFTGSAFSNVVSEMYGLVSGNKMQPGTCDDWYGTWLMAYDSTTDTLPDDTKGQGRNGTYEVKICTIQKDVTLNGIPFPCVAEGTRTDDGQKVYIGKAIFSTTQYYYYEIDEFTQSNAVNGGVILDSNFGSAGFSANANTCGLVSGSRLDQICAVTTTTAPPACIDFDSDGYGSGAGCLGPDCDDSNAAVNPAATEVCNGIDDNCNGQIDAGVKTTFYLDADGDSYGIAAMTTQACTTPAGYSANSTDCNDADGNVNPGETEIYNDIDDNCNGQIDEGFTVNTYYRDADGDGYGNPAITSQGINPPQGYIADKTDCNDENAAINPGATEILNGSDDNCNGQIDESIPLNTYYRDADSDGYGNPADTTQAQSAPAGYVPTGGDCNDADGAVNPGAAEVCNGIDDDCDGQVDEGAKITFYQDADNDTFGNPAAATQACIAPAGYVTNGTDCNDGDAAVYPGAPEVQNGVDDDCDGQIDEGSQNTYYRDCDRDGFGNPAASTQAQTAPAGYVADNTDCDDTRSTVYPGAQEKCNNRDDNCNGQVDEGAKTTYYCDKDRDGFGNPDVTTQSCWLPWGYVANNEDCDDTKATVYPGATELVNGIDDDCDGRIDEGSETTTYYRDSDSDGYGNPAISLNAATAPEGYVSDGTDCNDENADVHPGAVEICNGLDDDCDLLVDEGFTLKTFYKDCDHDGYGDQSTEITGCEAPQGYIESSAGFDCNDSDAGVHPGAAEICNGKDDDCSGKIDDADGCDSPCALKIIPQKLQKKICFFSPLRPFVIKAESLGAFTGPVEIDWGTTAIQAVITKIKKTIFGFMLVKPELENGIYDVTIISGSERLQCRGVLEVK